jgi:hypothetical protein
MEGFTYATALDLNMGYYQPHTPQCSFEEALYTDLPVGKEVRNALSNLPNIFQEKMSELMYGLENVRAYL